LATVLYQQGRFQEAIDICDYRINRNREASTAWYLKGCSLQMMDRMEEAYDVLEQGLDIVPHDEMMRSSLEQIVLETFNVEDTRRSKWAQYHIAKARDYEKQYEAPQAEFEYKQALRLNPLDIQARSAYANMLDRKGQQELYLEQLNFISSIQPVSVKVADTIEAYKSLLSDNLASRWGVDPFYLDKKRWNIGLYPYGTPPQLLHADASIVTVRAVENYFLGTANIEAHAYPETVTYSQAFRHARNANQDYFVLLEYQETERELLLKGTVFSGRNGLEVDSFNIYRTGNDRFTGALRYLCNSIAQMLPTRGLVIDRNADMVLVDLGSTDGLTKDTVLTVVKAGQVRTPDNTLGLEYAQNDILGTITLTEVSESVSQGRYSRAGFFDRMNIKDEVIIVPLAKESTTGDEADTQTKSSEKSVSVTSGEETQLLQKRITPTAEEVTGSEYPVLSRMLQDIYIIQ
jgi:tetratricopeptide (TPR) repeat protein